MQNSQNKIVIAIIVVGIFFLGLYIVGQQEIKKSVDSLEMEFNDFKVDKLSILPPEMDLTLTYKVNNPSNMPLKISLDGDIYYGATKISPLTVKERMIPAMDYGYIDAQISLNGSIIQAIGDPHNQVNYKLKGTTTVTVQYLGVIPVNVKLDLAELES